MKPKVAFFDFACCEGCQLSALDLTPEQFLELTDVIELVEFREIMSEKGDYDIAIVEGSITRDSDIPRLKEIRDKAKILITLGSCSTIAGINALKNFQKKIHYQKAAYPTAPKKYETTTAKGVGEIVKVDAFIPGCPIDPVEFIRIIKNLVLGKKPDIPTYPVCVECKRNENTCVYEQGIQCLGPVIRAGCNARCPSNGGYCFGCRGLIPEPNLHSQQDIMRKYNLSASQMMNKFKLFLERDKEVFPDDE